MDPATSMLDLTVVILTKDEELHLERCIDRLLPLHAKRIIVVDSESTDSTREIAESKGADVIIHPWPGSQALQFNWALDHLEINTEWILRMDADEYMLPELIEEIKNKLTSLPEDVTGVTFKRRHIFMDRWIKRGIYPVKLLRLFRNGFGKSENRLMDEHIVLSSGNTIEFQNDFCDHNLNNLSWFCQKHINYAIREAVELLDMEYPLTSNDSQTTEDCHLSKQAKGKRKLKNSYATLPLFLRSFAYFLYRYILKGGFLDGKEGFLFAFIQGWWYRTLVDAKILEIKRKSKGDPQRIKEILQNEYSIKLS